MSPNRKNCYDNDQSRLVVHHIIGQAAQVLPAADKVLKCDVLIYKDSP